MRRSIERKRDGEELRSAEWREIVGGFMRGAIDEAQMAALCMAALWRGMSIDEAYALTLAMVESGTTLHFDAVGAPVVDKHSSGGVSDIVSLVAVPLAAASGVRVAKLSGRALGHTGGTIDKLETIPGFNVSLSTGDFVRQIERVGCAIAAQTADMVPADKRIYALRDRTGTVPSMGLIAASIVSKKVAGGAHAFVFDVKTGRGGFMQHPEHASELARWLVDISHRFERRACALVSNMDEPLGRSIGTGIEVIEARDFLRGTQRDARAATLIDELAATMLRVAGISDAPARIAHALTSGAAYEKFVEMVEAQGATRAALEGLAVSAPAIIVAARQRGTVEAIDVVRLGNSGRALAAADSFGGIRVGVRIGERVERGAALAWVYGAGATAADDLANAFTLSEDAVAAEPLIYERISDRSTSETK